jgi:hypothetical protein
MEHYVTLFNSLFLPQGLALHMSMERHVRDYVLWVLCVDDETFEALGRLNLAHVRRLKLSDLETPELLKVKSERTIGEYCWTLTPFAPRFVFEADSSVERVTYIDADLWFRKHPKPIFDELAASGKQVLITDHAYAPEYDQSATSGQFCVQFMSFTRDGGETVRNWWEERCIEWCFARFEDGKFGDQKYLDDWPQRFGDVVHILREKELALAPWNASRFPWSSAIFYHFHGLRLLSRHRVETGPYFLPNTLRLNVYQDYFSDLRKAITALEQFGMDALPQTQSVNFILRLYRRLKRVKEWAWPVLVDNEQKL